MGAQGSQRMLQKTSIEAASAMNCRYHMTLSCLVSQSSCRTSIVSGRDKKGPCLSMRRASEKLQPPRCALTSSWFSKYILSTYKWKEIIIICSKLPRLVSSDGQDSLRQIFSTSTLLAYPAYFKIVISSSVSLPSTSQIPGIYLLLMTIRGLFKNRHCVAYFFSSCIEHGKNMETGGRGLLRIRKGNHKWVL